MNYRERVDLDKEFSAFSPFDLSEIETEDIQVERNDTAENDDARRIEAIEKHYAARYRWS